MYLLGYDIGSSSVKASLVDAETGKIVAGAGVPLSEMPISSPHPGWSEQDPEMWWTYVREATHAVMASSGISPGDIKAVGISYQMHGLVIVDREHRPLRPSIIWCDSRAVAYGERAFEALGAEFCLSSMLNSPGNFTAAKLAWVKENEPEIFDRIYKIMLPGDYIAMKLTGEIRTTIEGLSEGMLWNFAQNRPAYELMRYFGFGDDILPELVPTFGLQGEIGAEAAELLGLRAGIPVTYRAGDQPNNALSLNVMNPGEIASTAGTSGVVYGVTDRIAADPLSRINAFAHVSHTPELPRIGMLLCINGTGSFNAWARRCLVPSGTSYDEINRLAASAPAGSGGIVTLPFGNGVERMLGNRTTGGSFGGLNFLTHDTAHLLRSVQEGIAYAFVYGIELMNALGMETGVIRAGHANMFLSPIFRSALATVSGAKIELYDTDGAAGAARGAGIGVGIYASAAEAMAALRMIGETEPDTVSAEAYAESYACWKSALENNITSI